MLKMIIASILFLMLMFFSFCTLPIDPDKNPQYARITKENLNSIPDSVPVGVSYPCTLIVERRHLIDSLIVKIKKDDVLTTIVSGAPTSDTIKFTLNFTQPENCTIMVDVYKRGLHDSMEVYVHVFSTTPVIAFTNTHINMRPEDKVTCPFVITDPDSNLDAYILYRNGLPDDTVKLLYAQRYTAKDSVKLGAVSKLNRENVYSIFAIDGAGQISTNAVCTLSIKDTIPPVVSLLSPSTDTSLTIALLPCTLMFAVKDNWVLDSIMLTGLQQALPTNDTLVIVKTSLDSGVTRDSIELWDRGGNRSLLRYKITYSGLKLYPPKIKPIVVAPVNERGKFDTLKLDNYVNITDSTATYTKDSLKWNVTPVSEDPLLKLCFDSLKRTLYIAVKDTEISFDRFAVYLIKVTDPKGLSSESQSLTFRVNEKNDAPVITIKDQSKSFNTPFDTLILLKCGYDTDDKIINWTIRAGKYFKPDSIWTKITFMGKTVPVFTGRVAIKPDSISISKVPPTTLSITDSLKFTASDGELTTVKYVKFTWSRLKPMPADIKK